MCSLSSHSLELSKSPPTVTLNRTKKSPISTTRSESMATMIILQLSILTIVGAAAADGGGGGMVTGGELWCVAKNNAEDAALQSALDWACGPGGADCGPIQVGGACYEPQDVQDHASYAFNDYYLRHGSAAEACDFSGTAALTSLNPSQNNCTFHSSSSVKDGSLNGASSAGMGPADLSSAAPMRPMSWTRHPSTLFLLAIVLAVAGGIVR